VISKITDLNQLKNEGATMPVSSDSNQDDDLRSLTRLVLGAAGIAIQELRLRLRRWEQQTDEAQAKGKTRSARLPAQEQEVPPESTEPSSDQLLRYAMTGMVFDAQVMMRKGSGKAVRFGKSLRRRATPIIKPLAASRLFSPARKSYRKMVSVSQRRVDRWIEIGRQEESRSRILAQTALTGTVDETIDYLGDMPGVQELITTQSTSLAGEVIEEVRERTVAADILLEGFARSLFRRKPRYQLPPPPPAVQMSAVTLRSTRTYKNTPGKG
jgi:hypothetical protein